MLGAIHRLARCIAMGGKIYKSTHVSPTLIGFEFDSSFTAAEDLFWLLTCALNVAASMKKYYRRHQVAGGAGRTWFALLVSKRNVEISAWASDSAGYNCPITGAGWNIDGQASKKRRNTKSAPSDISACAATLPDRMLKWTITMLVTQ